MRFLQDQRAIETSDICLLLLDGTLGMEGQDLNIFRLIIRNRKGIVILVNKWDLVKEENKIMNKHISQIRDKIAPFQDVPVIFVSAINKQRIFRVLEEGMQVYQRRTQKIPTKKLNEVMLRAIEENPPPASKGKYIRIKYVAQLPTHAPTFAFFANLPQYIRDPYRRYLENYLRREFDFTGVPVQIFFRQK